MDQATKEKLGESELPPLPIPRLDECPFDPAPEMAKLRAEAPVTRVKCPTGLAAWLVTRYADVREVLGDAERFSSRPGQAVHLMSHADPDRPIGEGEFTRLDGPEYQRFRQHMAPELATPKRMAALRPMVQEIVDDRLDALAAAGPPADFYGDFAIPVTVTAIGDLVGVPSTERELFETAATTVFTGGATKEDVAAAVKPLHEFLHKLAVERRANPGDDALSRMIARSAASERPFTDRELVAISATMLAAGFDTTATIMSHGLLALLAHPAEFARLRADPALVPSAVEELVRFFGGAPGIVREATRDTEIGGHPVAEGDYIVAAIQVADRDPEAFDDPDRLDIGRRTTHHMGFGYGTHQCFGQQTARLEITVVLETLLRRVPSLRLATPLEEVPFKTGTPVFGPAKVPVAWDAVLPATSAGEA